MGRDPMTLSHIWYFPSHVLPGLALTWRPTIHKIPSVLDELLDYAHPDALAVEGIRHSDECYTIVILDLDYSYRVYRAHLSLDLRWTLSPCDNATIVDDS